jgi:hypothetical protein
MSFPRPRWFNICAIIFVVLLFVYFGVFVVRAFPGAKLRQIADPLTLVTIFAASLIYGLIVPLMGWAWRQLLVGMGENWSARHTSVIIGVTQLAKYIPGNVAQSVGRSVLAVSRGMNPGVLGTTMMIEILLMLGMATLVGLVCWLVADEHRILVAPSFWSAIAALGGISVCVLLGLVVLLRLLSTFRNRYCWAERWIPERMRAPTPGVFYRASLAYGLIYLTIGLAFWIVACTLCGETAPGYFYLTSVFALSWVVGFIAPGLPAGLGAREGAMIALLTGTIVEADILNLMIAMRMVTMLGDLLCFVVCAVLAKRYFRPLA